MLFLSMYDDVSGILLNILHALPNMLTTALCCSHCYIINLKGIPNNGTYLEIWFQFLIFAVTCKNTKKSWQLSLIRKCFPMVRVTEDGLKKKKYLQLNGETNIDWAIIYCPLLILDSGSIPESRLKPYFSEFSVHKITWQPC